MIKVFLGPDGYTKHEKVKDLATAQKAEVVIFQVGDENINFDLFLETDLFSSAKIFWVKGLLKNFLAWPKWQKLTHGGALVVLDEESIDKRFKETKEFLARRDIEVVNFILPHGKDFDKWLINKAKGQGCVLKPEVANELAIRLGRDEGLEQRVGGKVVMVREIFDLFQAENELKKLVAATRGGEITLPLIKDLVNTELQIDAFKITNAMAEGKKSLVWEMLEKFFWGKKGSDLKVACIQLNALLSEQLRNLLIVKMFVSQKKSEQEILQQTGWKSSRLFVLKQASGRVEIGKLEETLRKLAALDEEIKTGSLPERVVLDLIVATFL